MTEKEATTPTTPIKPQIVFDEEQAPVCEDVVPEGIQHLQQAHFDALQDRKVFGEDEPMQCEVDMVEQLDLTTDGANSDSVEKALKPTKRKWSVTAKVLAALVTVILGIETLSFFAELWRTQPLMASLYSGAFALIVALGAKFSFAEYRHLKRLKRLQRWHNDSQRMDKGEQIGEALLLCRQINKELPDNPQTQQAVAQWQGALKDTFTDKDVLDLYSQTVLNTVDEQALKVISRYASETSLMVAISPLAVMDMALVMWRSIKMIEQICGLYGVTLGYWSRIKLIKTVLRNVIYAGVTELIADVGAAALSLELAGKLSARAAQGLGAGLLTGRLGFKVMQLCRPVPALPDKQKRLGDLSKHLLGNIKQAVMQRKGN
ncbi:MAG: putative membrane protein [Phenylobacterium sp.]|jgi:putative membrane protein